MSRRPPPGYWIGPAILFSAFVWALIFAVIFWSIQ